MENNETEDNIPSDFFDDFSKDDFIKGLSVIDSWGDDNEKNRLDKLSPTGVSAVAAEKGKYTLSPNKSIGQMTKNADDYVSVGKRRDPAKTILAIKKDKEMKVKQMLTKCLESNEDLRPPGTELDEFYQKDNEDISIKKGESSPYGEKRRRYSKQKELKYHEREISRPYRSPRREHPGYRGHPRRHNLHMSSRHTDFRPGYRQNHHDSPKLRHSQSRRSLTPIWLRRSGKSPKKTRGPKLSRSPRRLSRSPVQQSSRLTHRRPSHSPHRQQSRSSRRRQSRSPHRRQSPSPHRRQSRSPHRRQSRSPLRRQSRSPHRRQSRSPHRRQSRSPHRRQSRSPHRRQSRSPHRRPSHSPHRRQSPPHRPPSLSPIQRSSQQTTLLDYTYSSQPPPAANYTTDPYLNTTPSGPEYTYPPGESAPYSDIYSYDYQATANQSSLAPVTVPVPMPVPAPVPAPDPCLNLQNQYSNLNMAPVGSISCMNEPRGGSVEGWSMDITSKVELLARCHDAVSNLSRLHLPNRLVVLNENKPADPKPLTSRYCSPLKRQPIISFNFTNVSGRSDQNKQLVDAITATIGLDLYVTKPKKNNATADKGVQTSTPFCQVCEIRDSIGRVDAGTKIDAAHFCASVESQVIENELLSSKSIYKSASGIGDGAPVSICHLTPAQLVSQLAARAKSLKRNENAPSDDYHHGMGSNQNYNFSNNFQKY